MKAGSFTCRRRSKLPHRSAPWHVRPVTDRGTLWLAGAFAAGVLLTGIPYWRLPYNANYFADPMLLIGFAGLGLVTAVLVASRRTGLWEIFGLMLVAFPAAVMIRVVIDTMEDPTDHNLWPFELIIAAVFSLIAVVPGLIVGALARRFTA